MANVADEAFGNVRTVKAFANEIEETSKFTAHNNAVFDVSKTRCIWQGFFIFIVQVLLWGSICLLMWSSGQLYQAHKIELGNIT